MAYKIAILAVLAVQVYTSTALPPCVCTRNLVPVCGSDGETYSNLCILECEVFKGKTDLTVAKQGPCEPALPVCICPYNYLPVCGTDGKTYPNRCALLCERPVSPKIDVASEGACQKAPEVTEPPCICTDDLDTVCGSDGNSYPNPCALNCATAKNSQLSVVHKGRCDDSVKVVNPIQKS